MELFETMDMGSKVLFGSMVGVFMVLIIGRLIHYRVVKKNYYRSHDGVSELFHKQVDKDIVKEGNPLSYHINKNLKIEISYFVGFFEMAIYQKRGSNWVCVKRESEDIWNRFNGLLPIKGPWEQEIDAFLKDEYQKNA